MADSLLREQLLEEDIGTQRKSQQTQFKQNGNKE